MSVITQPSKTRSSAFHAATPVSVLNPFQKKDLCYWYAHLWQILVNNLYNIVEDQLNQSIQYQVNEITDFMYPVSFRICIRVDMN